MELRSVGRYYTEYVAPSDYNKLKFGGYQLHPLYEKITMLYYLLKRNNGPHHWVNRIILDIQQYGMDHKLKKADLIAMNKLYNQYK